MRYCKFCGKEIGEANFCSHCGKPQHAAQENHMGRIRLHCPHCRSEQLTVVTEAGETIGYATHGRVTRSIGTTTYRSTTVNRHYWMCQECGHKFRNLEDLSSELDMETKKAKQCKIAGIVFGVFFVLSLFAVMADEMSTVFDYLPSIITFMLAAIFLAVWFTSNKKAEQMTAEKTFLEQNCFD